LIKGSRGHAGDRPDIFTGRRLGVVELAGMLLNSALNVLRAWTCEGTRERKGRECLAGELPRALWHADSLGTASRQRTNISGSAEYIDHTSSEVGTGRLGNIQDRIGLLVGHRLWRGLLRHVLADCRADLVIGHSIGELNNPHSRNVNALGHYSILPVAGL
jgi:hypothetical protein